MDSRKPLAVPDPRYGEIQITRRQVDDATVYKVAQTFTRELLVGIAGGKRVFVSVPRK